MGDKWRLVIVKQMLVEGRETFTESEEAISFGQLKKAASYLKAKHPKAIRWLQGELGIFRPVFYRLTSPR